MSLAGRLEDLALADIFQILSIGKKTGTFLVKGTRGTALIVFKNGLIVRAETDDIEGTLADFMLKVGMIKETVFQMAVEVKKQLPTQSLADLLLDLGAVSKEALEQATRKRIEHVIYRLLLWEDGDFQFELDDLDIGGKTELQDLGWELSKGLSPEYLLMEGARVQDESAGSSYNPTQAFTVEDQEQKEETDSGTGWDDNWGETPAAERKDITALKSLTQELRFPNSTSEITLLVLRLASDIFQRGVLFMAGKNQIIGLGQFGIEVDRADEKIRGIVLSIEMSSFLKKIIVEQMPYHGPLEKDDVIIYFMDEIGSSWPAEAAFFPIVAEGKVVAVLYGDNAISGDSIGETEGLEIFISHAGLALEKSLLQRRIHDMEKGRE
ncbi:MAG: DUF4388 domain-containing protein [Nitrospirota bacterium]|nr:DUF4388 domain-containing protein [Nitrospirota bacterium]